MIEEHGLAGPALDLQNLVDVQVGAAGQLGQHGDAQRHAKQGKEQEHSFIAASANIDEVDPEGAGMPIVRERIDNARLNCVISNSFGFGGTNATLAFKRYEA